MDLVRCSGCARALAVVLVGCTEPFDFLIANMTDDAIMVKRKDLWRFREQTARLICLAGPTLVIPGMLLDLGSVRRYVDMSPVAEGMLMTGLLCTWLSFPFGIYWLTRVWAKRKAKRLWLLIVFLGALLTLPPLVIYFTVGFGLITSS